MLAFARELARAVDATPGLKAVLTRDADSFVPLSERMRLARAAGADVLVSRHADALETDAAPRRLGLHPVGRRERRSLAADGRAARAQRPARRARPLGPRRHGRDGADGPRPAADRPAGERLAGALVAGLQTAGAPLNTRPRSEAPLAVLNAADFPSVLVETGFLSSDVDRAQLSTPEGRAPIVAGLLPGLQLYATGEPASAPATGR